jgi:uncharacterized membrane protein (UPF0127 family)
MRASFLATALLLAACSPQAASESGQPGPLPELDAHFGYGELTVLSDDGTSHEFRVYLATEHEQQRRGLMFVRDLPPDVGMLFIYESDAIRSMWMKNTYISLDMVFARADGTVVNIVNDTVPQTLDSHASSEPARFVLELNAGTARKLGIGKRSRLIFDD